MRKRRPHNAGAALSCNGVLWDVLPADALGDGGAVALEVPVEPAGHGSFRRNAWKKAVSAPLSRMAASSRRLRSALLSCAEGWGVSFRAMPLAEGMGSMWLTAPMTLPVMRPLERARKPEKKAMER